MRKGRNKKIQTWYFRNIYLWEVGSDLGLDPDKEVNGVTEGPERHDRWCAWRNHESVSEWVSNKGWVAHFRSNPSIICLKFCFSLVLISKEIFICATYHFQEFRIETVRPRHLYDFCDAFLVAKDPAHTHQFSLITVRACPKPFTKSALQVGFHILRAEFWRIGSQFTTAMVDSKQSILEQGLVLIRHPVTSSQQLVKPLQGFCVGFSGPDYLRLQILDQLECDVIFQALSERQVAEPAVAGEAPLALENCLPLFPGGEELENKS